MRARGRGRRKGGRRKGPGESSGRRDGRSGFTEKIRKFLKGGSEGRLKKPRHPERESWFIKGL